MGGAVDGVGHHSGRVYGLGLAGGDTQRAGESGSRERGGSESAGGSGGFSEGRARRIAGSLTGPEEYAVCRRLRRRREGESVLVTSPLVTFQSVHSRIRD